MTLIRMMSLVMTVVAVGACAAENGRSETEPVAETPAPSGEMTGGAEVLALPGATVDRPSGWTFRQPSSSMRLAEAVVAGPGGEAVLTVFFFGVGGGGGVDANLQRWVGQMEAVSEPVRGGFVVDGFTVSTVEVEGTQLPSRMGTGPSEPVSGSRLYGAVIEGPGGPWFFKLTGPAETVSSAAPAFDEMLRSVRP